ncbi:MAG TPA: YqgE/AlgH family protein, partial [Legionellaceae bacterium]|nr:YqgE/AlgH family protein [Legionellaceae bacterium]
GPKNSLIVMGYVGWDQKELEREVAKDNMWMICPYKSELLYEVPFAERWKAAAKLLGINMDNLTGVGHA